MKGKRDKEGNEMTEKKSKPVKKDGKLFRYDYENAQVEYISKAIPEMLADNEEWQAKFGKDLWEIDEDGYVVHATVGLQKSNWQNRAAREEYLSIWIADLDYEAKALARDFEKYELPRIQREMEKEGV